MGLDAFISEDTSKAKSVYPLPGGYKEFERTLQAFLTHLDENSVAENEMYGWFRSETNANSENNIYRSIRFIEQLGVIKSRGEALLLTQRGREYLNGNTSTYDLLSESCLGFRTLLDRLIAGPRTTDQLRVSLTNTFASVEWETNTQATNRINWLRCLNLVERRDSKWALTPAGRERITHQAEQSLYTVPIDDTWEDLFPTYVNESLDLEQFDTLPPQLEGYNTVRIWATREAHPSSTKQTAVSEISNGDCILFYSDGDLFGGGVIDRTFDSESVGELLWGQPESKHIYTLSMFTTAIPPTSEIWEWLGYDSDHVVRGFSRVTGDRLTEIRVQYGSVEAALFGVDDVEPTPTAIDAEAQRLRAQTTDEPNLTEETAEYRYSKRRARDAAFSGLVREAYENRCAVCGSHRMSPTGNPEVEAAHIYPKSEGGADDVRNGIALCKLHHWAFDSGWISLTDDYEVLVADTPEQPGYGEFSELKGQRVELPADSSPHPVFLRGHRDLHGFES